MLRLLFALVALGGVAGLVLGFPGALHPAFDTIAHFRWHFALLLLALAIIGLMMKIRRAPFILLLFAMLGVWQSDAGNRLAAVNQSVASTAGDTTPLRLLHYNLRFDNPQMDSVLAMFARIDADILSLNETSRNWMPKLETLSASYPYRFHCPEWNAIGGTMLLSKLPLNSSNDYCHAYAALGMSTVEIDGEDFEIGTVHMRWPWPASGPEQLVALEPRLATIGKDAIIVGDFNATTWSYAVSRFASLSGMTVQRGFGGTWMYKYLPSALAPFFGLPIDNVMTKGRLQITSVQSLPSIGSDHLPLLVEFVVTN